MGWLKNTANYLNELLGQNLAIGSVSEEKMKGLPFYLVKTYTPYELVLFGKAIIIVKSKNAKTDTPGRIAKDVAKFREHFERDVAIVVDNLASWQRKRLIEKHVPFIVPGRQLFLPMLLLDLREHFPSSTTHVREHLSRAAQHAILRQTLRGDLENRTMADIANILGYSAMTVTNIRNELVALDLCTVKPNGRALQIVFPVSSAVLWNKALPHMRSPVFRRHHLSGECADVLFAGTSALARQSALQPDELSTVAVWKKRYEQVAKENQLTEINTEEGAELVLEEWHYDPQNLSRDNSVDSLSLYLSLRDDPDERIQIALEEMMEAFPWSRE